MLGNNFDQDSQGQSAKSSSKTNLSLSTVNATQFVDPKIVEDEIEMAENKKKSVLKGGKRRSVDELEDFDSYSDDGFDNPDKLGLDDDAIVDEVEEEDTLKMIEAEICNTAMAKQDISKVKGLINKIDSIGSSSGKSSIEKL